jgi:glycine/D-amino acid oxidase-like deaminating enzyme
MAQSQTIWRALALTRYPVLSGPLRVDVAVVGGGITGITAARLLAERGLRVCVLEARTVGSGDTHATTGHLTAITDRRYHTIIRDFGHDAAGLVAESQMRAIDLVERWSVRTGCDLVRLPGFLFSETDSEEIDRELEATAAAGLRVTRIADPDEDVRLPFRVRAALRFANQAQIQRMRYLTAIADRAVEAGARIFEHTRVVDVEDGAPCRLQTAGGHEVVANAVFVATHAPLNRLFLQTKIAHYRTYVLGFPSPRKLDALLWDTWRPYHYVRGVDVDGAPWVVVGGGDHKAGVEVDSDRVFAELADWTRARLAVDRPGSRGRGTSSSRSTACRSSAATRSRATSTWPRASPATASRSGLSPP